MANTTNQGLPYPSLGDAANGPTAIQNLALAVEKQVIQSFASAADRTTRLPAPIEGMVTYRRDVDLLEMYDGTLWRRVSTGKVVAKMEMGADQSVPTNTNTLLDFTAGSVVYDTESPTGMVDLANSRLVIRTAGYYRLTARLMYPNNSTGYRNMLIQKNTGEYVMDSYMAAAPSQVTVYWNTTDPVPCVVGDYFTLRTLHTAGVALTTTTVNGHRNSLSAELVL